jgi:type IV pilus assembly protein PilB
MPIVDIVNRIIIYASQHKASDIHFDPREDSLMIRMRIDGKLRDHSKVPKMYEKNLATRVKLISKMNITETRVPQDGAIKGIVDGRDLDMRVSCLPTNEGEKIVVRLLDYSQSLNGLDSLGFTPTNLKKIERLLDIPNGIILVTGATGSGKSTTTYSMVSALNTEDVNIITVEDPVEMNIEGINQVYVNSEIGLTFASALRSILRQDPDVILIGEIRDSETAQIAIRAAITGHLVISTIHTNSALNTIERLLDMNVERYLLSTALNGIISQKLARTLCPDCKKERDTTNYEKEIFRQILGREVERVYEPVGCDKCHRGFRGRIALHEVLVLTDRIRDLINDEETDKEELRKAVYSDDTTTLLQDALEKVIEGYTTFKEVYRVVDIDFDIEKNIRKEIKKKEKVEQAKVKLEIIDLFTDDEGSEGTIEISKKEMEKIKKKAREAAKNKYKIKATFEDNDLLDVFADMPPVDPSSQPPAQEQKVAPEKKEDKKEDKKK